jgi:tetratricopeptide (TPR) repeat protein
MRCLTENTVVELVEDLLAAGEKERVHDHLGQCGRCRELVSAMARLVRPDGSGAAHDSSRQGLAAAGWLPRGSSVDRYVVLEQVGAGSAGTVYAAYDPDLDRRVALKLLRTPAEIAGASEDIARTNGEGRRAILLREARAMARLSHPNVVTVHDVGLADGAIFVAMEFVAGHTLREWREARERSWPEIRDVFLAAARGLAAAHRAGLVHRDFKPDNVLIGEDGRVLVTDFGLARLVEQVEDDATAADAEPGALRMTRTGAIVGTPAYMAPEQLRGEAADALSDQFSFCAALFEAIHGERPFDGRSIEELRDAVVEGRRRPVSPRKGLPAAVPRALERGLAADPAARFASMDDLCAELAGRPRHRRWLALAGVAALVIAAGAAALWPGSSEQQICTGAAAHLAGIWNDGRRRAIGGAFAATRVGYAGATWKRVDALIDGYTGRWIAGHTVACRATRVLGEQSEAALDLRMQCLASRRRELGALVDVLAAPDATVVEKAVQAASSLRPVADCADLDALAGPVPPPSDPARVARLEALADELASASALRGTGRWRDALELARPLVAKARELAHPPFLAEVLLLVGALENATGDAPAADRTLREASLAAESGRDDAVRARALIDRAKVIVTPDRVEQASELAAQAEAIAGRLHDRRLNGELHRALGKVAYVEGRVADARRHYERGLVEEEAVMGSDDPRLSNTLDVLGDVLERMGEYDAARRVLDRARAIGEQQLGPDHPTTAAAYSNLANLANSRGRMDEALALYDRVIAIRLRTSDERNSWTATAFYRRGQTLRGLGRIDKAEEDLERALRITEKLGSSSDSLRGLVIDGLGSLADDRKDYARAASLHRQALAIHQRIGDQRNIAPVRYALGMSLLELGKPRQALAQLQEAARRWEKLLGPDHPHTAYALHGIGRVRNQMKRYAQAIEPLERAYRIWGGAKTPWGSEAAIALAEALWMTREDPRAIDLTREALAYWRSEPRYASNVASAEAWLERHARRR